MLLLVTHDVADFDILWPIVIIGAGLWILFHNRVSRRPTAGEVGQDSINVSAVFSGSEQSITSQSFQGGNVSASFGAVELDLRAAKLAENPVLNVNVFMGGVELSVPDEWVVNVNGSPVLGGIEVLQAPARSHRRCSYSDHQRFDCVWRAGNQVLTMAANQVGVQ